jgi:chromosomal replication initiator protein
MKNITFVNKQNPENTRIITIDKPDILSIIWFRTYSFIYTEFEIDSLAESYFNLTYIANITKNLVTLVIPTNHEYLKDYYLNELNDYLIHALSNVLKTNDVTYEIITTNQLNINKYTIQKRPREIPFDYTKTINTFCIDDNNQKTFAILNAISDSAFGQKSFNPILLHGSSGTGKSHLLNAYAILVYNKFVYDFESRNSRLKVKFIKGIDFIQDYTTYLKDPANSNYIYNYYRNEVLIIDDFEQILLEMDPDLIIEINKIVSKMRNMNRQVLLSYTALPSLKFDVSNEFEKLLQTGKIIKLETPDRNARDMFIRFKVNLHNSNNPKRVFILDIDVKNYLLNKYSSSIKLLDLSLSLLIEYSSMNGEYINKDVAHRVLEEIAVSKSKIMQPNFIIGLVATYFNGSRPV